MSAVLEWSAPMMLTSPEGTLLFNVADESGRRYGLVAEECDDDQDVIAKKQKISGGDGDIFSRRSKSGFTAQLALRMFQGEQWAIGEDLMEMWNTLLLHLNALFNPSLADLGGGSCRLQWTPSGSSVDWMLDRLRALQLPKGGGLYPKVVRFAVDTELPYALREDQFTTFLPDGVETTLDHSDGTTGSLPVFKVYGDTVGVDEFLIVNAAALDTNGNPLQIKYRGSTLNPELDPIGSTDHVEITCLRETVVLNGNEDFLSISGIDIPASELRLPIVPGLNPITITGADADVLWNSARA